MRLGADALGIRAGGRGGFGRIRSFTLTIEDLSEDGAGVGRLDGYIWFVKDAVIGDVVRARAMKMKKNYGFARLMEVLTPSPDREDPPCPVARPCGGCHVQAHAL